MKTVKPISQGLQNSSPFTRFCRSRRERPRRRLGVRGSGFGVRYVGEPSPPERQTPNPERPFSASGGLTLIVAFASFGQTGQLSVEFALDAGLHSAQDRKSVV